MVTLKDVTRIEIHYPKIRLGKLYIKIFTQGKSPDGNKVHEFRVKTVYKYPGSRFLDTWIHTDYMVINTSPETCEVDYFENRDLIEIRG